MNRTVYSLATKQHATSQFFSSAAQKSTVAVPKANESPLRGLADSLSRPVKPARGAYPEVSDRKVGYWLIGSSALVFGIVVLGGLTRLTESGCAILPLLRC